MLIDYQIYHQTAHSISSTKRNTGNLQPTFEVHSLHIHKLPNRLPQKDVLLEQSEITKGNTTHTSTTVFQVMYQH